MFMGESLYWNNSVVYKKQNVQDKLKNQECIVMFRTQKSY